MRILIITIAAFFCTSMDAMPQVLIGESMQGPFFTDCIDRNLGYIIRCSSRWTIDVKQDSLELLVENEPGKIALVTISKSREVGLGIEDLTPKALQHVYEYSDNFRYGKTRVARKPAVMVVANSEKYPQIKILDYFVFNDGELYRINFTVNNKDYFFDYEGLFEDLIHSFKFNDPYNGVLTLK